MSHCRDALRVWNRHRARHGAVIGAVILAPIGVLTGLHVLSEPEYSLVHTYLSVVIVTSWGAGSGVVLGAIAQKLMGPRRVEVTTEPQETTTRIVSALSYEDHGQWSGHYRRCARWVDRLHAVAAESHQPLRRRLERRAEALETALNDVRRMAWQGKDESDLRWRWSRKVSRIEKKLVRSEEQFEAAVRLAVEAAISHVPDTDMEQINAELGRLDQSLKEISATLR